MFIMKDFTKLSLLRLLNRCVLPIYTASKYRPNDVDEVTVAQWVKRWPTDLADRVRSPLDAKSSQP